MPIGNERGDLDLVELAFLGDEVLGGDDERTVAAGVEGHEAVRGFGADQIQQRPGLGRCSGGKEVVVLDVDPGVVVVPTQELHFVQGHGLQALALGPAQDLVVFHHSLAVVVQVVHAALDQVARPSGWARGATLSAVLA